MKKLLEPKFLWLVVCCTIGIIAGSTISDAIDFEKLYTAVLRPSKVVSSLIFGTIIAYSISLSDWEKKKTLSENNNDNK